MAQTSVPSGVNLAQTNADVALRNEEIPVSEVVKEAVGGEFCLAKGLGSGVSGGVMGSLYGLGESAKCTDINLALSTMKILGPVISMPIPSAIREVQNTDSGGTNSFFFLSIQQILFTSISI